MVNFPENILFKLELQSQFSEKELGAKNNLLCRCYALYARNGADVVSYIYIHINTQDHEPREFEPMECSGRVPCEIAPHVLMPIVHRLY